MADPVVVDIPHKLGRDAARARIAGGVAKIAEIVPGGGHVSQQWEGDTLHFTVSAMGQQVVSRLQVFDASVHAEVDLPPMLALFAGKVRDKLFEKGATLLR
ncbi:polyhydroxyalkanoic acid system family protein [Sphingomonas sp. HF-S4]|uniref:Polyhydroxyalkanoic acid system family protein n=1 Tax=Sphingomonas agrestis TaxID=3080540 RepID=A0ABU3Y9W2_9SPHN|nr:polyhydroxyalkanoic acid system family protein [Sphingomonas sp. HF-S4]MDV3458179.1 polyhydroxyalkanoic acid system family protein [Sphingomonas sp. HF-S4]